MKHLSVIAGTAIAFVTVFLATQNISSTPTPAEPHSEDQTVKDSTSRQVLSESIKPKGELSKEQELFEKGMSCYKSEDIEQAVKYLKQAADLGLVNAQYELGKHYYHESIDHTDWVFAHSGMGIDYDSFIYRGWRYRENDTLVQYRKEAIKWYTKAAEQGYRDAQSALGKCYFYGSEVPQSFELAEKWLKNAALQGDSTAGYELGFCYLTMDNDKEAVRWFLFDVESIERLPFLGDMYMEGRGVQQDYNEAAKWFEKAVEKGAMVDEDKVGYCYWRAGNIAKAIKWGWNKVLESF